MLMTTLTLIALATAVVAIVWGVRLYAEVRSAPATNPRANEIASAPFESLDHSRPTTDSLCAGGPS